MDQPIHLDFETRSSVDLNSNGVYAYAASPDAEVLCLSVCVGDEKVESWANPRVSERDNLPPSGDWSEWGEAWGIVCNEISDGDGEIWAHNASFELVIWNRVLAPQFGLKQLDPRRMRCTASLARRAVIPTSLEKCAAYLNLKNRKDKRGVELIKKFCIPEFDDPNHFPDEFEMLIEYCEQDVEVEREIHAKLKAFDRKVNQKIYLFNALVNETGFPVNTKALKAAQEILVADKEKLSDRFRVITGGLSPTQTTRVLEWFHENGYGGEDLRKLTVDEELEKADTSGLPGVTGEALRLRQLMSLAAVKKVPKMIELADADERVRGTLMDHGASTGRSSSKLVQQQNFRRSTNASEMFYRAFATNLKGWDADCIETIHGDVADVFSTSIRHFIHKPGEPLVAVDYAAIECRVVNWVAEQEDALKEFREGLDRYILMASRIYGVPVKSISKGGIERFLGKQAVLGCGYQMGASKFQGTCANYSVEIPVELAEKAVTSFRATHDKVVNFWYSVERTVKRAILTPGKFQCKKVVAFCATVSGIKFLFIKLPSGRLLSYPEPKVIDDRITYFGQLPNSTKWGRCETYGGKITENIVQAISADIMVHGGMVAIENGHEVCMMVHDEAVKLTHGKDPRVEDFIRCLTTLPEWAEGLPLVAEGKVLDFYSK